MTAKEKTEHALRVTLHHHPAEVSTVVLEWAIKRAESNTQSLAKAVGTSETVVSQWIVGERKPSFVQARRIGQALRVPFGFLFLSECPPDDLPIPDFRRIHGHAIGQVSLDLRDVIFATLRRQDWLREYRKEQGASEIAVVGSMSDSSAVEKIASSISESLGLERLDRRPSRGDDFTRQLIERAENLGISVLRSGIVGLNTHRKLDMKEFRGFSISDPVAPFIFLNSVDAKAGQLFTLVHELTHIWLGQSGISGSVRESQGSIETLCNKTAAEVLVPQHVLALEWDHTMPINEAITQASRRFRVSNYVVAIKAYDSGYISRPILDRLLDEYDANLTTRKAPEGGHFYKTTIARNGRVFAEGVLTALSSQRVLVRDAAALLEVKPAHLGRLEQELHGGS